MTASLVAARFIVMLAVPGSDTCGVRPPVRTTVFRARHHRAISMLSLVGDCDTDDVEGNTLHITDVEREGSCHGT
ncbi:hypothetical protein ACWEK5_33515 [Rhodococcus koreensis]